MIVKRALLSIVIFNKDNSSIEPLIKSIRVLQPMLLSKLEIVLVNYDKKLSKENQQSLLSVKRMAQARFMDYTDRHPESDLAYYHRGKKAIVKTYKDVVTEQEILDLIKGDN